MGIKNLSSFIREKFPQCVETIHISEYAYKRLAIDTSLFMCIFKASYNERWVQAFIKLVECLRKNQVHCVFIYDTTAPPEKALEREERISSRDKLRNKIDLISESISNYESKIQEQENLEILLEFQTSRDIKPRLLLENQLNIVDIKKEVEKLKKQNFHVSKSDFELTKKLFDILNVPYYQAPMEAETMCADLCKQGLVDGVLSRDTDVLAYGSPVFLTNLVMKDEICERIVLDELLEEMNWTYPQFLDFCIMCGTDYNRNMPKIGSGTAYKLIDTYKSIDALPKEYDISILRHIRSRQLFTDYERVVVKKVPYCTKPNFTELLYFLVEQNINLDVENIKKSFAPPKIELE